MRHQRPTQRNKRYNDDREPNGADSLRNGDAETNTQDLKEEEEHNLPPRYLQEWFGRVDEAMFLDEENEFLRHAVAFDGAPADDEKDTAEETTGHRVENNEERTGHCAYDGETHEEMADALFDYHLGDEDLLPALHGSTVVVLGLMADNKLILVLRQRVCMDGSLRDQTVGHGNTDDASDETCGAEEGKVPVKTSRLLERVLSCLSADTADVVVIVKQQGHEDTNG